MTEVDAVVPEGVSLPVPTQTDSSLENTDTSTVAVASNIEPQKLKDNRNGASKDKNDEPEIMEVDGVDTEEDDSQITSSTENGGTAGGDGAGDDSKISEDVSKQTPLTSDENSSNGSTEQDAKVVKTGNDVNEDSSSACDGVSPTSDSLNEKTVDDRSDSVASLVKPSLEVDESTSSSDQAPNKKPTTAASVSDSDGDALSEEDESSSNAKLPNNGDEASIEAKDMKSNDSSAEPMDCKEDADPLPVDNTVEKLTPQKENGVASSAEKARNDAGIVDLGDDSDEEMEVPKKDDTSNGSKSLKAAPELNATASKARSVCSDSDGAVIIGSDSENEAAADEPMALISKASSAPKPDLQIIDDDDDDCVVIEDDTPAPVPNDLSKRKSMGPDSDDSQPPNKRQRNGPQSATLNQITIKDARSLMPQEAATKRATESGGNVYPVNITPAPSLPQSGPPKLVPMGGSPSALQLSGLPGMSSNANLLPGLTDDMFVLEAPSFIVPYIYEKPPADVLKDVLNELENKYKLTTEDLAEAVKSDEFDMMTEQNKQGKKKKKRRGGDDPDESWSEESDEDEDEDDDDSEAGERTKVLIKEASDELTDFKGAIKPPAAVVESVAADPNATSTVAKPGQENYFESPLGKFFMDIGVGLVQEFVQSDLIRLQKRKMRKSLGKNITEFERAINALAGNLEASKKKNSPFKFTMKRCEFCNFKSESALSMANHYETPHMNGPLYKCNFCIFEIRNATEIVYHMEAVHNIKARLIKPLPYHQCPNCGFEDNGKAKLGRHQPVCAKKFRPELNLAPPNDWEAPAKIPRIKPRHGLVGTATAYQAMAAQAAAQKAALASIQLQQQQVAHARSLQAAALAAQNAANKIRARQTPAVKPGPNGGAGALRGPNQVRSPMATNVVLPNNYQLAGGQLMQAANALAKKTLSGQPSISITPLPRQSAVSALATSPSTSKMPPTGMKPGQNPSGRKAEFVICEICDGYIKDLEQLRNHMQWMHKVKIHPKMIYNRPPLNCQKCQFRFFTDQGLERHLLGSHGLVTSSMQEAANKGKDAGRCPVCGRMYQWKLLNHVSRDHHMTLKPAHLSYKCTVCTATFGMYKQFETHVYTAHSTVAKKAMDGKKSNAAPAGASSSQRSGLSASNDSLLKPLKINDEITIIPQPASKPRITNMESHVID